MTKKSILIVDDDPANLDLLSLFLRNNGYQVRGVLEGAKALAVAQSIRPDLILLDIKMPDMDGYELCQRLKAHVQTEDIPLIFISVLGDAIDKVKAFSLGGVDYITKPFQFEEVLVRVQNHLTIRGLQKQLLKQNAQLKKEISARISTEDELHRLNVELEKRVQKRTSQLNAAREQSEKLLLKILPQPIIERLKLSRESISDDFEDVTILFADIVEFTKMSSQFTSGELVNLLNRIFTAFDRLAQKHQLEKIKTIGDAYLVVGGLPEGNANHAASVAEMALDMQKQMSKLSEVMSLQIQLRIGINSGPITAGVIGENKFIYDLWGDTVNTASRMESYGLAGEIQVSEETHSRLKDKFLFEKRGIIEVKGKGEMRVFLLKGSLIRRPAASK
ncbi:MAG: response regulator [Candidatus Marinimicrobia bacterium]|nr:response regulator [Candidatus Neomarinimicrobiota bacterium]